MCKRERDYISNHSTNTQPKRQTRHCPSCTWWGRILLLEDNTEPTCKSLNHVYPDGEELSGDLGIWLISKQRGDNNHNNNIRHYRQGGESKHWERVRQNGWANTWGWSCCGHREEYILCVTIITSNSHNAVSHALTNRKRSGPIGTVTDGIVVEV